MKLVNEILSALLKCVSIIAILIALKYVSIVSKNGRYVGLPNFRYIDTHTGQVFNLNGEPIERFK